MDVLHVDCGQCRARGPACDDCVVSVLLGPIDRTLSLAADEVAALDAMAGSGLVPPLRMVRGLAVMSDPQEGFALGEAVP